MRAHRFGILCAASNRAPRLDAPAVPPFGRPEPCGGGPTLSPGYGGPVHRAGPGSHPPARPEDPAVPFERTGHDDLEPMTNMRVPKQPIARRHFQHYDRWRVPRIRV